MGKAINTYLHGITVQNDPHNQHHKQNHHQQHSQEGSRNGTSGGEFVVAGQLPLKFGDCKNLATIFVPCFSFPLSERVHSPAMLNAPQLATAAAFGAAPPKTPARPVCAVFSAMPHTRLFSQLNITPCVFPLGIRLPTVRVQDFSSVYFSRRPLPKARCVLSGVFASQTCSPLFQLYLLNHFHSPARSPKIRSI